LETPAVSSDELLATNAVLPPPPNHTVTPHGCHAKASMYFCIVNSHHLTQTTATIGVPLLALAIAFSAIIRFGEIFF
jgi:hypothetical protein